MQRPFVLFSAVAVVAAVACAQGSDEALPSDTSPTAPAGDGGGAPVNPNADDDHDGYPAKNDCNDSDPAVHPGAVEVCNGKDDDCNGKIDEGFDKDGDGYATCAAFGKGADCDDADPAVHPGASEVCNNKDDDCNGKVDDGFDQDGDGFTTCARGMTPADCDDNDPGVRPGAVELCNGKDDDCDGQTDEVAATLVGSLIAPINSHWGLTGSASVSNGWAQLVPDAASSAGALWWVASYSFDSFDVTATIWIQAKSNGADGMAFAWVPGSSIQTGAGAAGFGATGLGGFAVAIDTFQNAGEPAVPYLALVDGTSANHLLRASLPDVRDGLNHTLRVKLDAGQVSAWVDGVNYINGFAIPSYVPFTGHWGFTAATGGLSAAHWVKDITMSFPNGQGCVP